DRAGDRHPGDRDRDPRRRLRRAARQRPARRHRHQPRDQGQGAVGTAAPTRPHPRSRVESRPLRSMSAGQWLRGAGAALALLVLLVAVPLALLRWGEWPFTGLPTGQQIRDLPSTVASDAALIGVFTVALGLVWGLVARLCAGCVGAEVVAEVRGRDAGRVRVAGPLQGVAGRLVATVAMNGGAVGPVAGGAAG